MTFLLIATIVVFLTYIYGQNQKQNELKSQIEKAKKQVVTELMELAKTKEAGATAADELAKSKSRIDSLEILLDNLHSEVSLLAKYRQITDAESYAEQIKSEARAVAKTLKERAEANLNNTQKSADALIATAKEEAQKIAGSAYEALQKAETLEQTAMAMKNIIDGYGDRYLVPTYTLLDKLAEDYSFTQAGQELKRARDNTKAMVKSKTAAECDYVEANRRETAIDFVTDAFNGKTDTILANVKEDNYGTLERKIQDAFHTVNHNGAAFRNARITELFLAARLAELKWACTAQALKEKEREEQRQIREQMREEEKAAREIEKALRDAQKEEESIAKSMEKVKKDLESANEAQKAKYEAKLLELNARLAEAEANNQRALSMAQQTKRGYVYVISNIGSFGEDVLKIGMTRRLDPMDRIWELGDASVPFDFDVHAMILSEDAPALERTLHDKFRATSVNKINPRKEFFRINLTDVRNEIENLGAQTHWTMKAEAKEFRESLVAKEAKREAA